MPTIDLAPFHLAVKNGYFQAEGLTVEASTAPSGPASVAKMVAGEVDVAYSSYTPFFQAKSQNAADIKLVADASSAGPKSTMVLAMPGSAVRTIQDMPGKRVAVTARGTISDLMTMATMKAAGVDYQGIQWINIPFPDMAPRLQRGDVDAAFMTEPYITGTIKTIGAVPVFDTAAGPTADFPTAGFGATAKFVAENPKTVAAFQRVMAKATAEAADRSKIEPLLVEFAKVDKETAAAATLLTFRSTLDAANVQRVPDLMLQFGAIPGRVDVAAMIVKP
ncbi:NitT/TauT family transport system substrate-binding protein [Kibdelosporangium banguiense]|uniref:NitT/TauT family transport system substrate-binding protein n=2 Tax=Kibdelosporangium banguiense TaxID=1365924 RepID=A0ABS4TB61_9PSEU|nr:NitT/TauT family transport system substrate-binding protein [Kibdelosporangium banguiense]